MDVLVEALQSLGVSEGVRLLTDSKPKEDEHSSGMQGCHLTESESVYMHSLNIVFYSLFSDSTADSGFGSQSGFTIPSSGEEGIANPAVANH